MITAGAVLVTGAVLLGVNLTSASGPTDRTLESALESFPDQKIVEMRQMLAAQIQQANATRAGEKSEMLLGYERQLAQYDQILRDRGIDPGILEAVDLSEAQIRDERGP